MNRLTESILAYNLPPIFTVDDVKRLEPEDNVRHCQMRRAMVKGDIIRIRRGYYTLNKIYRKKLINQYVLAQRLVPGSYISFETALRDVGWIPEFVRAIKSTTLKNRNSIDTHYGTFSYESIPQKGLYIGTVRRGDTNDCYVEAKPLKALADFVYERKYEWTTLEPLIESLRIEIDDLETLTPRDFDELEGNYESSLVENFLSGIRRELAV
jgi:hypothetical protein